MIKTDSKLIDELLERGVDEVIIKDQLRQKLLSGQKLRIKLGIDPTSPNLHLGRSIPLLKLRDLQQLGHQIVFIVGDFTGVIGDTSDKDSERPMLSPEKIKENMIQYLKQVGQLIDLDNCEFHYNSQWLGKLTYSQIGEQADQFSVAEFIARDNIRRRLETGSRVSVREMLYPLMQGYDSVVVKADVELGGTDQRFNLLAGRKLQEHFGQAPQNIIMTELAEGTDGRKMSSSWGNTINFTDQPTAMYAKVMGIGDNLIIKYFILMTRLPLSQVQEHQQAINNGGNPRDAKMALAKEIVSIYHGQTAADQAEDYFIKVVQQKTRPEDIVTIKLAKAEWSIIDLLLEIKATTSRGEARRLIEQGGVKLSEQVITDSQSLVKLNDEPILLQKGKKQFWYLVTE
jgi:tyrosyl-tRNA synthetase